MPRFNIDAWLAHPQSAVAIVGATGWVGRAMVDAVLRARPDLPLDRLRLFAGRQRPLEVHGRALAVEPVAGTSALGPGRWLVVHAGVIGGDASPSGEVRRRNDELLESVLELAARTDTRRLVIASSGAAGFADDPPAARAAYAWMKRDHEVRVREWSRDTGVRVLVPRIFNLGGPYMTSAQNYALGDFILRLSQDRRLAIGAAHPVFRSYVHVLEAADVLLDMAVDDMESDDPFDVAGDRIVELGDLAREVKLGLGAWDAEVIRPASNAAACDWYVGDGHRYRTALFKAGRSPTSLSAIIADTIHFLRAATSV
jgi:nucleoside-diphosphate-sugar epimerase